MTKQTLLAATALVALFASVAQAVPIKTGFETADNVAVPAAPAPTIIGVGSPVNGVPLSANSEINDEFAKFRINSGAGASNGGDTFGAIAAWVEFDPVIGGRGRVIAGASAAASGLGNATDFRNFLEVRVLEAGHDFFSAFVGGLTVGTFSVIVTSDEGGSDILLNSTSLADSDTFSFTNADPGKDIRRVVFFAGPSSDGIFIDDVCAGASATECDLAAPPPPPPPPPPTTAAPTPATLALLAPFAAGLLLRRRRQHG